MIVTTRTRDNRAAYAREQAVRRDLIRRGVPASQVTATPRAMLNRLDRETPERPMLVVDVDTDTTPVEDLCPNLAFRPEGIRTDEPDAETWDEWEATRYAVLSCGVGIETTFDLMRAKGDGRAVPRSQFTADDSTPWDFTGGDAA